MVKYLFNDKIQVFTNDKHIFNLMVNCQKTYGDYTLYNNILSIGKISICWGNK